MGRKVAKRVAGPRNDATDQLTPCPFCGCADMRIGVGEHNFDDAYVACTGCGAQGPLFDEFDTLEENGTKDAKDKNVALAVAAWNRRTA